MVHQNNLLKMMAQGWSRAQISRALLYKRKDGIYHLWRLITQRFKTRSPFKIALLAREAGIVCLLALLAGCSTPQYSPVPPPNPNLPHAEVMQLKPLLVGQPERVVAWEYPFVPVAYKNGYRWSLESSANLVTWTTVTNYPPGYVADTRVTNDWRPELYYRMHGRL